MATTYLTFPIAIFKDGFNSISSCCNNAMYYAGYAVAKTYDIGTNAEKMASAGHYLGITWGSDNKAFEAGKILYNSFYGTPVTSVSKDIIFDYYKNKKTDFQIACFLAFLTTRSILQTKPYCKTNKAHIHARMLGYASVKEVLPQFFTDLEGKYAKRWHMDKVLKELEFSWGLKTFADHSRGFYIGFQVEYEVLAKVCLEAKKKTKENKLRSVKQKALVKAQASILD